MARPIKDGVDYFPKDTDFYSDDKVRLLRAEFGSKGMYLLDYLLCDLYGKNGYYIKWDRNKCYLVSDGAGCGCDPQFIEELISGCVRCSFFDERVFTVFGILTSGGIQRRYIRMFNSRDEIQMIEEYWLLDVDNKKDVPTSVLNKIAFKSIKSAGNPDKSTENPVKNTDKAQSKIEDTNVSQSKDKKELFMVSDEIKDEWHAYVDMRKKIKKPLTQQAMQLAVKELNKLAPNNFLEQKEILNNSVFNCWQGLFALRGDDTGAFDRSTVRSSNKQFTPSRRVKGR